MLRLKTDDSATKAPFIENQSADASSADSYTANTPANINEGEETDISTTKAPATDSPMTDNEEGTEDSSIDTLTTISPVTENEDIESSGTDAPTTDAPMTASDTPATDYEDEG